MLPIKTYKVYSLAISCLLFLAACGGSGNVGNNIPGGGGGSSGFVVVQAVDQSGNTSFASNELEVSAIGNGLSISWSEPTRLIGEACLGGTTTLSYRLGVSTASGSYTFLEPSELSNFGTLVCGNDSGSDDTVCSVNITTCSYTLTNSPL